MKRYKIYKETYDRGERVFLEFCNTETQVKSKIKQYGKKLKKFMDNNWEPPEPPVMEGDNIVIVDTKTGKTFWDIDGKWKDLPEKTTIITKKFPSTKMQKKFPDFWSVKNKR